MQTDPQPAPPTTSRGVSFWIGWFLSFLVGAAMTMSAVMKLKPPPGFDDILHNMGWQSSSAQGLAIVELTCVLLFLIPRTALLGAILLTAYLGGATATHVRLAEFFLPPIIMASLAWFALLLRDARLRPLLPWRRNPDVPAGGFLATVGKIVLTLGVLLLMVIALGLAAPAEYHIVKVSPAIEASAADVFPYLNDFRKWEAWSPWEKMEKEPADLKKTFEGPSEGVGAVYKWEGKATGKGMMTILESKPNERIRIKLDFFEMLPDPKDVDTSDVVFTFKEQDKKTKVTWSMAGKLDDPTMRVLWAVVFSKMVSDQFDVGFAGLKKAAEAKK